MKKKEQLNNNNQFSGNISTIVRNVWSDLDKNVESLEERKQMLNEALDNNSLIEYVSSTSFKNKCVKKNKKAFRAEEDYLSLQLEKMADMLLDKQEREYRDEFPIRRIDNNQTWYDSKRLIHITNIVNESKKGIHLDQLAKYNDEYIRNNNNRKLTEKQKREQEQKLLDRALETSKVLQDKAKGLEQLDSLLSDKDRFVKLHDTYINNEKDESFSNWQGGKERIDIHSNPAETVHNESLTDEFYSIRFEKERSIQQLDTYINQNKKEFVKANKQLTNEDDVNERWQQTLKYYGMDENANNQYAKLRHIRNDYKGEMNYIAEELTSFIKPKGSIVVNESEAVNKESMQSIIVESFELGDPEMVLRLISIVKINNEFHDPAIILLIDEYEDDVGNNLHTFMIDFLELVKVSNLDEVERAIMNVILQKEGLEIDEKHLYKRVSIHLHNKFGIEKNNEQIKRMLKVIAEKIAFQHRGTLTCTKCKVEKDASSWFGEDIRKKFGYKSICRDCERENAKKYRK